MNQKLVGSTSLALTLAAMVAGANAQAPAPAATPAPAAAPEHTLTANVGIFSQYIFRGISQTAGKPALQGGFDYAHASGFYAGTWASNASWLEDFGLYTRSSLEWDFYGGYKANFGDSDFFYDVGTIYYYYPGNRNPGIPNADTWELYAGVGWKWASAKFSYSLKDYFGAQPTGQDTDGSWYLDLSAAYPLGDTGVTLIAHFGILDVRKDGSGPFEASYNDWKLGAAWTVPDGLLKGLEIGAYYSDTNSDGGFYTDLTGKDTAEGTGVVYVKKTF